MIPLGAYLGRIFADSESDSFVRFGDFVQDREHGFAGFCISDAFCRDKIFNVFSFCAFHSLTCTIFLSFSFSSPFVSSFLFPLPLSLPSHLPNLALSCSSSSSAWYQSCDYCSFGSMSAAHCCIGTTKNSFQIQSQDLLYLSLIARLFLVSLPLYIFASLSFSQPILFSRLLRMKPWHKFCLVLLRGEHALSPIHGPFSSLSDSFPSFGDEVRDVRSAQNDFRALQIDRLLVHYLKYELN